MKHTRANKMSQKVGGVFKSIASAPFAMILFEPINIIFDGINFT